MRLPAAGWPSRNTHAQSAGYSRRSYCAAGAVATIVIAAGVTAGAALSATQQPSTLTLRYACAFPAGSRVVSAQVSATFPATAMAGNPIQPTGAQITVTLPHVAMADLTRLHAAAVRLAAELGTRVTDRTKSSTAAWRHFRSPAVTIPRNGPLTLTASGMPPVVRPAAAGEVTVTADDLALAFAPPSAASNPRASSSPAASSTPSVPHGVQATCAPRPDQGTTLATIAVTGSAGAKSPGHPPAKPKYCQPFIASTRLNPRIPLPHPLPGATPHAVEEKACANSTGFTDARKLNEAALIGPGLTDLILGIPTYLKAIPPADLYIYERGSGRFEYHGLSQLPPAHSTLLAFGFMPVSATIQLSEVGPLNIALISCGSGTTECLHRPLLNRALVYGRVSLRIYDVNINGVPLNVGPHCQTATPFDLKLTGVPPAYSIAHIRGVLTGTVKIPLFSGCANGTDNLDPVFDATVSGPGNFAKVTQAVLCFISPSGPVCPPRKPNPKH